MPSLRLVEIEPTVFFVREQGALRQRVCLTLQSDAALLDVHLVLQAEGLDESVSLGAVGAGTTTMEAYLPDLREPQPVTLGLLVGGERQDEHTLDWEPQRHWEVHWIHYSHHDLGYTDLPTNVLREHDGFLDDVIRYADETADWAEADRFHYQIEEAWSALHFVENRSPEQVQRLVAAIRRGQVELGALLSNEITELCGHEELVRLLYPSVALSKRYGVPVGAALHNDIPGVAWGVASVLAGAGVRHLLMGIPRWYYGLGEERVHPLWDEEAVLDLRVPGGFWWEAIDGSRVLLWYSLHGGLLSGEWQPTSYQHVLHELPKRLAHLEAHGYPYDMVNEDLRGGHRDNAPAIIRYAYIAREWNSRWAYPRLINTTTGTFLRSFEARWGDRLKILRGDIPGTDYPAIATCTPRETALNRRTHDDLLAAETWSTLAAHLAGYTYPRADLAEAYQKALYFDEHVWGMSHPGGPAHDACWSEKSGFAYRAAALAHDARIKALNKLMDAIERTDEGDHVTLFNPLSWARDGVVRIPLRAWRPAGQPMHWEPPQVEGHGPELRAGGAIGRRIVDPPAALVDEPLALVDVVSGERLPVQRVIWDDPLAARPWAGERVAMGRVDARHAVELAVMAHDLPPTGYRTYRVVAAENDSGADGSAWGATAASGTLLENDCYRIDLDPDAGTIRCLWDKALGRDLVDANAPHGFGQLLARLSDSDTAQTATITDVMVCEDGPLLTTLRIKGELPGCPSWTKELTLYHTIKRLDLDVRLLRDATPSIEYYCAFPFAFDRPRFRFEAPATVIEPLRDQLPGTNTDYYGVQHWVQVRDDGAEVVWASVDAPMAELGGLWPGYVSRAHHGVTGPGYGHPFLQPGELTRGHIYSLLSYSNVRTNFVNVRTGEALLRYRLTSGAPEEGTGRARAFGWEAANPPEAVWSRGPHQGALPSIASLCQVDVSNVMVLTLKQAEDGQGMTARLIETEGQATEATLTLPHIALLHAYETNLVEENRRLLTTREHTVRVTLPPFGMATLRLVPR